MRFMLIGKATKASESGQLPTHAELVAMETYTEELQKAGVLLDLVGLAPSSKGARLRYEGKKCTVIDGPFAESKELIAGYFIIQVSSREEAIEWARRAPFGADEDGAREAEIRQIMGPEDFAPGGGWSTEK